VTEASNGGRMMDGLVASLPRGKGTYALVMRNEPRRIVRVGALGEIRLESPWLVYVGSALGPGGLRARVGRHIIGSPNRRWHIDRVRAIADLVEVWWLESVERKECAWATAMATRRDWRIEVPRFGSSDCRCEGHLLGARRRPRHETAARWVADDIRAAITA
jgi:Uri superfamily endonuclease